MKNNQLITIIIVAAIAIVAYLFYKRTKQNGGATTSQPNDRIKRLLQFPKEVREKFCEVYDWYKWADDTGQIDLHQEMEDKGVKMSYEKFLFEKTIWDMRANRKMISHNDGYILSMFTIDEIRQSLI
ncbi:MAG: hypothetical protein M0P36_11110 [Bacteroidales bacterium]|nr:hypothetical protein [Bacteroidales bacterium]